MQEAQNGGCTCDASMDRRYLVSLGTHFQNHRSRASLVNQQMKLLSPDLYYRRTLLWTFDEDSPDGEVLAHVPVPRCSSH